MSVQARESKKLINYSGEVISKQQINSKKSRFDSLLRMISYIFYGILFGLLSASFKFANTSQSESIETNAVIGIFGLSFLSLAVIYWTFKGEIRKYLPVNYYLAHLLNAVLLCVGVFVLSWFPVRETSTSVVYTSELKNMETRQFILMCSTIGWALVDSGIIIISFLRVKKLFPLSWSKIGYSCFVLISSSLLTVFLFLAAKSHRNNNDDLTLLLQIVSLAVFFVAFLIFVLGISFIKIYRDVLLGERTEFEMQAINNWEDAKTLSIVSACSAVITFITIIFWDSATIKFDSLVIISIALDALLVVAYFLVVLISKIKENGANNLKSKFVEKFKSIDNAFLIEIITWLILCKTIIIQGATVSNDELNISQEVNQQLFFIGMISFGAIVALYIITTVFNVQTPNIKNTATSLCVILGAVFLESTTLAFIAEYKAINHPVWLSVYMVLPLFIGTSVSLLIRMFTIIKIFNNKTSLRTTQQTNSSNENNFIDKVENNESNSDSIEDNSINAEDKQETLLNA